MDNTLAQKIREAEQLGHYLITVTMFDSSNKGTELSHWYLTRNFPRDDIQQSIDEVKKLLEKETVGFSSGSAAFKASN